MSSVLLHALTSPTTVYGTVHPGELTARSLRAAVRWGNHSEQAFAHFSRSDLSAVAPARSVRTRRNLAQMQRRWRLHVNGAGDAPSESGAKRFSGGREAFEIRHIPVCLIGAGRTSGLPKFTLAMWISWRRENLGGRRSSLTNSSQP
jgi:hypothetical protein